MGGAVSSSLCTGFSLLAASRLLWPWVRGPEGCGAGASGSSGPGRAAPVGVEQGLPCSAACGIFRDRGSNLDPLRWQADSYPLCDQKVPLIHFLNKQKRICSIFFCTLDYLCGLQTVSWRRLSIVLYSAAYLHIWFWQQVYWAQELGLKLLCKLYSVWNIKLLVISLVWGNDQKWESARLGPLPACCFIFGGWGRRD